MRNPVFGILVGFVLTTIVQSSSASLGIIQSLAKSGLVQIKDVMFFNLGQNIGSCTTAMLASLSFNRDAKRVSIINLTFNIVNAVLFTILYSLFPFDRLYQTLAPGSVVEQIAFMHTFTNIVTSLVCFPIAGVLAKVAYLFIPDQGSEKHLQPEVEASPKMENNTAFNIYGINIEINNMLSIVESSIREGLNAILEHFSRIDLIRANEAQVNQINKGISRNLLLLMASNTNMEESRQAASLFSMNVDLERMSDHAVNIAEAGDDLTRNDLSFSLLAYDELEHLSSIIFDSFDALNEIIGNDNKDAFARIKENENMIDELCMTYRTIEIDRMRNNAAEAESGVIYSELLIDIERIGDHIMNVAENLCNSYEGQ